MDLFCIINKGMKYQCEFPKCGYITENRTQIHEHHIIPRELNGSDKKSNKLFVCPNCHNKIFIPDSNSGIHSFNNANSIIINHKLDSTSGPVLEYVEHDETKYWFL